MKRVVLVFLILFSILSFTDEIKYKEKIKITYVIYEGFYISESQAKENITLMQNFDFEDLKIVPKTVKGQQKYGILVAETDSFSNKNYIVSKLKRSRFGALVYQKKKKIRIPIKDPANTTNNKTGKKTSVKKPKRTKELKQHGLIKKEKRKLPAEGFIAAGAAAAFGGLSYMYYTNASELHDEYMSETDSSQLLGLWDGVEVNQERYLVYMSASIALGVFSVYQLIWGNRPEISLSRDISVVPLQRGQSVCVELKLKF